MLANPPERAIRLEPLTVVLDDHGEQAARMREPDAGAVGAGVLGHVGEGFAGYEVGRALHVGATPDAGVSWPDQ
jgi:hypothetical protein